MGGQLRMPNSWGLSTTHITQSGGATCSTINNINTHLTTMSEHEHSEEEEDLPVLPNLPEIGRLATWSVSSHKYGFGVDNLRDNNENTFWQ